MILSAAKKSKLEIILVFVFLIYLFSCFPQAVASSADYSIRAKKAISKLKSTPIKFESFENHIYTHKTGKKQALIIVTGVAEPALKYWSLLEKFKHKYDLYFWDHVGHGRSSKISLKIDSRKAHIDSYQTYLKTFRHFLAQISADHEQVNVISHSMGSHIVFRHLLSYPGSLNKVIAIAPMIDVRTFFIPQILAKKILTFFYKPTDWAPFQSEKMPKPFLFTSRPENFVVYQDFFFNNFPNQLTTGVTAGWLVQTFESINILLKASVEQKITQPTLFFTAGKDVIVNTKAAQAFCLRLKDCQLAHFPKAKHQILLESKQIQDNLFEKIHVFLQSQNK